MWVKMTADHITHGFPGDSEACPIAQALLGLGCTDVNVLPHSLRYCYLGIEYNTSIPIICQKFMIIFDEGSLVPDPIEFEIELLEQVTVACQQISKETVAC